MGQTLTNGIFLPNEGERNCYEGLAGNWRAIDGYIGNYNVHVADAVIHVSQADRDKWDAVDNKADSSALTAHTGNTTIHVTAEDKAKWDAVTSKANDTDVLHKTGDETAAGIKTFSDDTYIKSLNVTNEVASQSSSGSAILPLLATITYRDETPSATARFNLRITAAGEKSLYPHENNLYSLGLQSRRLKEIHTYSLNVLSQINGINPGALSLPDLSAAVDISSYITNLNKSVNTFTPPADGWMYIRVRKTTLDHVSIRMQQQNGLISSTETADFATWGCHLPVVSSKAVEIYIYADGLASAYFYPCQGNV